ncbi:MAG: hypothetical protein ACJ74J_06905 [Blastocatellia bacterium]
MLNIGQNQHTCNGLQLLNHDRLLLSKARSIRVVIASNFAHETAYFVAVIYVGSSIFHYLDGWLDGSTAERAWLHALGLAFEWRDRHTPNARLFICNLDNDGARRQAA